MLHNAGYCCLLLSKLVTLQDAQLPPRAQRGQCLNINNACICNNGRPARPNVDNGLKVIQSHGLYRL